MLERESCAVSKPQGLLLLRCYPSSHDETFNDFPFFLTFLNEQNTSLQQIMSQHYPSFQVDIRQGEKCLNCSGHSYPTEPMPSYLLNLRFF